MKQKFTHLFLLFGIAVAVAIAIFLFVNFEAKKQNILHSNYGEPKSLVTSIIPPDLVKPSQAKQIKQISGTTLYVPILMYHHIGDSYDQAAADLTVSPQNFEAQVKYFKESGYNSVTLKEAYNAFENSAALPSKPIVFTFDDGYEDAFVNAVPILKKYGYVGSFAIATELLGRPSYGVWNDVFYAKDQGMEIISHSENHLDLTKPIYSKDDLYREIFLSKQILEEKLGTSIDFFVYPYGRFNQTVEQMIKDAGYKMALTTEFGTNIRENYLFEVQRVRVHGQNGLEKLRKIFEKSQHIASAPPNL